jgi:hypothetical protein
MSDKSETPRSVTTLEAERAVRGKAGKVGMHPAASDVAPIVALDKRADLGKALRDKVSRAQHGMVRGNREIAALIRSISCMQQTPTGCPNLCR